jgi:ribonuclease J
MSIDFKKLKDKFLFFPVGGCNFIGTNFYLYHFDGTWIAIDCGLGFADKMHNPGVDILVPDLSILEKYNIKISALIITHSHEDHIGAVCDVYDYLKCPVYVTTFSKNFLDVDILEAKIPGKIKIVEIKDTKKLLKIGKFDIEFVLLTHSIVESFALVIKTAVGTVFHTGDWKIDNKPLVGGEIDITRLEQLGESGEISALICDSTNVLKDGDSESESSLDGSLYDIVKGKKGAVVMTTFASNLSRMQVAYNVAKRTGRTLFFSGHSMHRIFGIAQKSGYLHDVEYCDLKDLKNAKRSEVLILATGCQGETMATIAKLANGKHNFFKLQKNDTVIFSSKTIPGNEVQVSDVIDKLIEKNIDVVTEKDYFVHVSGHPYRGDLKKMYNWLKPKAIIPMHGNWLMLSEHVKFAKECGIKNSLMPVNGSVISISDEFGIEHVCKIEVKSICIDGNRHIADDSKIFKERIIVSQNGFITCNAVVNQKGGIVCHPTIDSYGIFDYSNNNDVKLIKAVEKKVLFAIKPSFFGSKKVAIVDLEKTIMNVIKNEVHKATNKLPVIRVVVKVV